MSRNLLIIFTLFLVQGCAQLSTPKETGIAVGNLIDELQIAVNQIGGETKGSSLPPLKLATVTFATTLEKDTGGGANLMLAAKGSRQSEESNSIELELVPDPNPTKTLGRSSGNEIADYVVAAVRAVDKKAFLRLNKLTVEAGLTVTKNAQGGIEVELAGISVDGTHRQSWSDGHRLKLVFSTAE